MRPILSMLWRWTTTFKVSGRSSSLTRRAPAILLEEAQAVIQAAMQKAEEIG
jgi:hypothetical protein